MHNKQVMHSEKSIPKDMKEITNARRGFIKRSVAGLLGISSGTAAYSRDFLSPYPMHINPENISPKYPSTDDKRTAQVVGASHGDFDTVKKLVSESPELALATWDWGFGDWESALGAASHVGRKDIADFLIAHGARPNIFTLTMMGALDAVSAIIKAVPGIQRIPGPHGITLLQHAKNRLRAKDLSNDEVTSLKNVVSYLESLGDADQHATSLEISEQDKSIYLGKYSFGNTEDAVFEISLNSGKLLQIRRNAPFGRVIHKVDEHTFSPAGAPSVKISFVVENGAATSLTIHQPEPLITANRI